MLLRTGIVVAEAALAAVCTRHHVLRLAVFGSSARGDFRPDSDVDVLVDFEPGARVSLFDLADLRSDLTDLIGVPVDLVTRGGLKPLIRERILSEARPLYAAWAALQRTNEARVTRVHRGPVGLAGDPERIELLVLDPHIAMFVVARPQPGLR